MKMINRNDFLRCSDCLIFLLNLDGMEWAQWKKRLQLLNHKVVIRKLQYKVYRRKVLAQSRKLLELLWGHVYFVTWYISPLSIKDVENISKKDLWSIWCDLSFCFSVADVHATATAEWLSHRKNNAHQIWNKLHATVKVRLSLNPLGDFQAQSPLFCMFDCGL